MTTTRQAYDPELYRCFVEGTVPDYTTARFFEVHPWIDPVHQYGHVERTTMVEDLIRELVHAHKVTSVVDLGCGDGSLLGRLRDLAIPMWGYDAGIENRIQAAISGLDVRPADLLISPLEYADLIVAAEVIEHLVDPQSFIRALPGEWLILSSPSAEDLGWHYEHHAWAWSLEGYVALIESCGWSVVEQVECSAPDNFHGGVRRAQRFQAVVATKQPGQ